MKSFGKVAGMIAILTLMSVATLMAQITSEVNFTTTFPFYAGKERMPAGSYTISPGVGEHTLKIESTDSNHSAYFDVTPTHSENPHTHTDVTFHRYGNTEYLNRVWVEGQRYGMRVNQTEAEQKAAASAQPVEHSVPGIKK